MIVCTATLLFTLLIFMPIRLNVDVQAYYSSLSADIRVKMWGIKVFGETISLDGNDLNCNGTVETRLNITQLDGEKGKGLLKCLTVDSVFVSFQNNMSTMPSRIILAENVLCAIATRIACGVSHCQIGSQVYACLGESRACFEITASVNVAELSFCLLKQGVQVWTRKSAKS